MMASELKSNIKIEKVITEDKWIKKGIIKKGTKKGN